jgi:uncharacterized OsmC-like protein
MLREDRVGSSGNGNDAAFCLCGVGGCTSIDVEDVLGRKIGGGCLRLGTCCVTF